MTQPQGAPSGVNGHDARDLVELRDAIHSRQLSAEEAVKQSLALAEQVDGVLGTFIHRFDEQAVEAAREADRMIASGDNIAPLTGVPLGIKCNLATVEQVATGQSLVHDPNWYAGRDADSVAALRAAGGVMLGHTTMVEHAMGRPDPSRPFPPPHNPWDPERWPGGSSSGTGIGVASQMFTGGLGTDTAGSVRLPAALCGVTGLKTTFGLVSTNGCMPAAPSLDIIGPIARSARDCRVLMDAMLPGFSAEQEQSTGRIAVPDDSVIGEARGVSAETRARLDESLRVLADAGYELVEVEMPEFDEQIRLTLMIMVHEVFLTHRETLVRRWNDYGRSFRRLAALGALIQPQVYDTMRTRQAELRRILTERFSPFDAVATPSWPTGALPYFANGGNVPNQTNYTAAWNAVGFPAISLPIGFDEERMPVGLQLAGVPGTDARLLTLGEQLQAATDWHRQAPDVGQWKGQRPDIPDPDTGVEPLTEPSAGVDALRQQGVPLDEIDAAVIQSSLKMLGME